MMLFAMVAQLFRWASNIFASDASYFSMAQDTKIPWRRKGWGERFSHGLARALATEADIFLVFAGSNRNYFSWRYRRELEDVLDLSQHLGAPSIAIRLEGRARVVIFAPHPSAAAGRNFTSTGADVFTALTALLKAFKAADIVIRGSDSGTPTESILETRAWTIIRETLNRSQLVGACSAALRNLTAPDFCIVIVIAVRVFRL
ncbi:hypothetical protein A4X13_0g4267 [Tilletia indica]|uniref:Uncharacterized protein n=1 Tax=Tilletia indica TaxID=43049 RepID=A0A8T8SZA6_9BASI|nr:hypothetical protein A4X13_0g4267 [Tilletia indica]